MMHGNHKNVSKPYPLYKKQHNEFMVARQRYRIDFVRTLRINLVSVISATTF